MATTHVESGYMSHLPKDEDANGNRWPTCAYNDQHVWDVTVDDELDACVMCGLLPEDVS